MRNAAFEIPADVRRERFYGVILAIGIGIALGAALFYGWSN